MCKELGKSDNNGQIFKNVDLHYIFTTLLLAVNNYKDLMESNILHSNPSTHYVKGVLEYNHYNNHPTYGLFHLFEAANVEVPIPEALYLYVLITE